MMMMMMMTTQTRIPLVYSSPIESLLFIGLFCAVVLFALFRVASSSRPIFAFRNKEAVPAADGGDDPSERGRPEQRERGATDASPAGEVATAASAEDLELLERAREAVGVEQYLVAARLLRRVSDPSLLDRRHRQWLDMADKARHVMEDLSTPHPEDTGWTKLSETHGHRDCLIYYKVDEQYRLTCRIETPIEESMLVPLLAVCNETDLFHAAGESVMVKEFGRGNQITHVLFDTPFPFANREMYQYGFAVDEIDEGASIVVKIYSLSTGTYDGVTIPPPERGGGHVRVDYDSGILIRSCPADHPVMEHSRGEYPAGEKVLLLSLTSSFDAHIHFVPVRLVNYVTRIMIGYVWGNLLRTTEEVRDGKRPAHTEAIQRNQELYGWVEERVKVMLAKLEEEQEEKEEAVAAAPVENGTKAITRKGRFRLRNPFRKRGGGGGKRKERRSRAVPESKPAAENSGH